MEKKSIFAVTYDGNIRNAEFYSTKELARENLKAIVKSRIHKLGVHVNINETDKFSFTLGWEERQVTFSIVEIELKYI